MKNMKKIWLRISLSVIGLVSTLQVWAAPIDMGGFQIEVGAGGDVGIQTDQSGDEKTEPIPSLPAGEGQREEDVPAVQTGTPIPQAEPWETFPGEESAPEQETDRRMLPQAEAGSPGESTDPFFDMIQEEPVIQEEGREEMAEMIQESQAQAAYPEQDRQDGPEKGEKENGDKKEDDDKEVDKIDVNKREKNKRKAKAGEKAQQKIRFVHEDLTRLSDIGSLAVRLEGEEAVCVLSCTVNRRECAYRWEGGCLLPVDPLLQKGMNCMELLVLLGDGQMFTMEPWYFSCGVGPAML